MHEGFPNKKNPDNSPVPPGCDEKYFWKIVAHISGDFGGSNHLYKSRSGLDIKSYHNQSVDKYGDYIPHMEKYIKEAQKIIVNPNHPAHKLFEQVDKGIFIKKEDIIARLNEMTGGKKSQWIEDAEERERLRKSEEGISDKENNPTPPFIDLGDEMDNDLKGGSRVD